jgi:hypothetical protein
MVLWIDSTEEAMRMPFALVVVLGAASLAAAQEGKPKTPEQVPPRYGIPYKDKVFPQATPKDALISLIEAADKNEFGYLAAHLLDPSFVDARVTDRAKQLEDQVATNLAALRDFQQKNLDKVVPESRVPLDAEKFRERIVAEARAAAFKLLVKDLQEKFIEDPETLKAMRLYRSGGTFPDSPGDLVKVTHADLKERSLFIKKQGDRYYIENRQADAPEPKEPEKKEPEKKEPEKQ